MLWVGREQGGRVREEREEGKTSEMSDLIGEGRVCEPSDRCARGGACNEGQVGRVQLGQDVANFLPTAHSTQPREDDQSSTAGDGGRAFRRGGLCSEGQQQQLAAGELRFCTPDLLNWHPKPWSEM